MPTSATGTSETPIADPGPRRPRPPIRGFTLLEVLVVVFIVGIVLGIAVINLPSDDDEALRIEAARLDTLIGLASEAAIVGDQEIALEISPHGYRFLVREDGTWRTMETAPFRPRSLPETIRLDVRVDGIRLELDGDRGDEVGRLYILSSGETTPFELTLARADGSEGYRIVTEIDGQHRIEAPSP